MFVDTNSRKRTVTTPMVSTVPLLNWMVVIKGDEYVVRAGNKANAISFAKRMAGISPNEDVRMIAKAAQIVEQIGDRYGDADNRALRAMNL